MIETSKLAAGTSDFSLVILLSGKGSNLQAILDAIQSKQLKAKIKAVISDKENAYGLNIAQKNNIPAIFIEPRSFESREAFDQALLLKIDELKADLVVLAGFMRILSDSFVKHFEGRLINIHPSLLPKFKGLNTHNRVLAEKETCHGCSVHFVSTELDGGPIIAQSQFDVSLNDDIQSLQNKVHLLEHKLYPQVIQWIAEGKVSLDNKKLQNQI